MIEHHKSLSRIALPKVMEKYSTIYMYFYSLEWLPTRTKVPPVRKTIK